MQLHIPASDPYDPWDPNNRRQDQRQGGMMWSNASSMGNPTWGGDLSADRRP